MKNLFNSILALLLGVVVGGIINMLIITYSVHIVPPPSGVDVSNPESVAAAMHLYTPAHFLVPFVAHAVGTLVGAFVAYLIAARHRSLFAYAVGGIFLLGGIAASLMIPAPAWFIALDLTIAYLPMAYFAARLAEKVRPTITMG